MWAVTAGIQQGEARSIQNELALEVVDGTKDTVRCRHKTGLCQAE